jgi:hypothetical protein
MSGNPTALRFIVHGVLSAEGAVLFISSDQDRFLVLVGM